METQNSAAAEPIAAPHRTQEQYLQLPMSSPGTRNEAQLLSLKDSGKARPNALSLLLCRVGEVERWHGEASPDRFSNDLLHTVVTEQQKSSTYLNRSHEQVSPGCSPPGDLHKPISAGADGEGKIERQDMVEST